MVTLEKTNLEPSYCLFNDIKHIDLNLLSINKKCIKTTDVAAQEIKDIIRKISIIKILIMSLLFVLVFSNADAYIIEENKTNYLIFALTENNRKMLEMYKKLWSKIKKQIKCNSIEAINILECNSINSIIY